MILLFQVGVVLCASRVARWLMVPVGQPPAVGEMVAGLLPSFFGWLIPETSSARFADPRLPSLNKLSQLGLVLFMFFIGVRVNVHKVAKRTVAMATSITSIAIPFALGAWLASGLHNRLAPPGEGAVPFALFFGAALSITAFPVLARILLDQRLLTTELRVVAIRCAAFDGVTGWLILAGMTTLVRPDGGSNVFNLRLLFFFRAPDRTVDADAAAATVFRIHGARPTFSSSTMPRCGATQR